MRAAGIELDSGVGLAGEVICYNSSDYGRRAAPGNQEEVDAKRASAGDF